ncbi:MAG: PAS domain S-box protein [Anaerolineae bacterium]|nr:PAS domain S-box protein [Anaerolineae bacterium]
MKLPLTITTKLTLFFVLFAALLLVGVGALAYLNGRAALEAATTADLLSTAIEKEAALNAWVEDRQADLAALSHSPELNEDVAALVAAAPTSATAQAARDHLVRGLQTWVGPGQQYLTLLVMAAGTGQVIAATDPGEEGKFKEDRPYFINGQNGPYVQNLYYSIAGQELAMTAAAPLRSADGRVLAVLAGRLNLAEMNDIINRRTGLHQTDDTLLVNTSSLFVTQPRFLTDPVVLRRGVHTEPVRRCLAPGSGVVSAADYRGVPVIAVYRWLAERQLCLIVNIDQAEALAPARAFGRTILLIGGLALLAASVLAIALARTITGPVKKLTAGAQELGSGKLAARIEVTTGDELEQLAGAFTQMAADLQQTLVSRDDLLKEVVERKLAEEQFRLVVEASPNAIILVDPAGRIHLVNRQAETLFGYTREELLGQSVELLVPPQIRGQHHHERNIFFSAPQARPMGAGRDLFGWRKDGSPAPLEIGLAPITTSEGAFVLVTAIDITERKQAEEALQESEERYRSLFQNNHSVMLLMDPGNGDIIDANPAACAFYGYPREEITGLKISDINRLSREQVFAEMEQAKRERRNQFFFRHRLANGEEREVEVFSGPIEFYGKTVLYSIVHDITERRQAEEEVRQLNADLEQRVLERTAELNDLYNHAPCGYHSLDGDGLFVHINDTELNWLGYMREEIIGRRKFSDLLTPASIQTFAENFPLFKERGWVRDLEFDMVRKDGSILPVLLSASAIFDQEGRYLASRSTIIDHTERKRAEAALRESQAKLEAANKELEAFAYSVSHDLRAPLRGIDGFSQALLEDYADQLDEEGRRYLQRVRAASQRMAELIDDLLTLSRLTRSEMRREPVNLSLLAQAIAAELRKSEPDRRVEFDIAPGLVVTADAPLMRVALENLLGNAWKYTAKHPSARIEVGRLAPVNNGKATYFVRDDGAGFDMAYAGKLFGAFQRLHTPAEFEGTGIGLATVQRIIHRHGGQVWAEGAVDQGATFYFTL